MSLFKAKTADQLEEKLMNLVNGYAKTLGLKEEVTTKMKNAEGHVKLGLMGGLGIGALGLVGGIASIPLMPAIATTAVIGGFTAAGVAILGGGAGMSVGLAYAGIGKLYTKYQESKLGDLTSRIFEDHRMKMADNRFENKFSQKFHTDTDYAHYSGNLDIHSIVQAVKKGDMEQARGIVKEMVAQTDLPENKITKKAPLFKEPIADDMSQKLGKFFDTYNQKISGQESIDKSWELGKKMEKGLLVSAGSILVAGAGVAALSSFAVATGGLGLSVAALGYMGIKKIQKMVEENKYSNKFALEREGDAYIKKMSKDLNIDIDILKDVQYAGKSEASKDYFIQQTKMKETASKMKVS